MKKIPTLYLRDENDRRYVTDQVTPGCEWVLAGEGVATRKWDGTCVLFDDFEWWSRREVKSGKTPPVGWVEIEADPVTGKSVGWEPINNSSFHRYFIEALTNLPAHPKSGTYELVGPKINANPDNRGRHVLIPHGEEVLLSSEPTQAVGICRRYGWEGVVWHHPDGRMAKLKVRDLRAEDSGAAR